MRCSIGEADVVKLAGSGCNSSVECSVWDRDAVGSIPATPTQRVSYNGITLGFQPKDRGSTPLTRSGT